MGIARNILSNMLECFCHKKNVSKNVIVFVAFCNFANAAFVAAAA